jgi:hypothetical protein
MTLCLDRFMLRREHNGQLARGVLACSRLVKDALQRFV